MCNAVQDTIKGFQTSEEIVKIDVGSKSKAEGANAGAHREETELPHILRILEVAG